MKKRTDIEILYDDDDIVVVSKPSSTLTIPDRYNKDIPNLYNYFKELYGEIFLVHRLDRDTSGVMIFAKNPESHKILNDQFQEKTIEKIYHAVVSGTPLKNEIDIDIPITEDAIERGKSKPSIRGKESLTKLRVLEKHRNSALVECNLVTGRHHQIRVHCAAIGHPLLVDSMYGKLSEFYLSSIKRKYNIKKNQEERPIISRVTLHSYSIGFTHPRTNEPMKFAASYPRDFMALLHVLQKYSGLPKILSQPLYKLKENIM